MLSPEGVPAVDLAGKGGGRGVYVAPEELAEALSERGAQRVFRGKAKGLTKQQVDRTIADTAERLEGRILELIGICRRAGALGIGMDAVEREIQSGQGPKPLVVVVARDLSERSERRVRELALARSDASVEILSGPEMASIGRALGKDPVGVIVTWHTRLSRSLLAEAARLSALLGRADPDPLASAREHAPAMGRAGTRTRANKETRKND